MSSSYGGDFYYDPEGSDIDDLDNEVSNIARKQQQKREQLHQSHSSETELKQAPVKHDDIEIMIEEGQDHDDVGSGRAKDRGSGRGNNAKQIQKKPNETAQAAEGTVGVAATASQFFEYTPEEK